MIETESTPVHVSEQTEIEHRTIPLVKDFHLKLDMDTDQFIQRLEICGSDGGGKKDILADVPPQVRVHYSESKTYESNQFFLNQNDEAEIRTGNLETDGSRITLLHEIEHAKRLFLSERKRLFSQLFGNYSDNKNVPFPENEIPIEVSIWNAAVEHQTGKIVEQKKRVTVPETILSKYIHFWTQAETESWQEALAAYDRLKQEGYDLEPHLSREELERIRDRSLMGYQKLLDSMEIGDQMDYPCFIDKKYARKI